MAITTLEQLKTALPGQALHFSKGTFSPRVPFYSLWLIAGQPGAGAAPSSGVSGNVPTNDTTGALPFANALASLYLGQLEASTPQGGNEASLLIYDRLLHNSGIDPVTVLSQTLNTVPLTRPDALGHDVEAWWEVYATMGSGSASVSLSYTNQDGVPLHTAASGALTSSMAAGTTGPFRLLEGDTGVRSVQLWTNSSTFLSGTFGLVLRRRIATIPLWVDATPRRLDAFDLGLPQVYNDACIEFIISTTTGTASIQGEVVLVEG